MSRWQVGTDEVLTGSIQSRSEVQTTHRLLDNNSTQYAAHTDIHIDKSTQVSVLLYRHNNNEHNFIHNNATRNYYQTIYFPNFIVFLPAPAQFDFFCK